MRILEICICPCQVIEKLVSCFFNQLVYLVKHNYDLLLFLGLLLLFGYIGYAQKRMRGYAKWVLPVTVAFGLTILSWLAAEALAALAVDTGNQAMADSAQFGKTFLPVIFVAIVVLGYVTVIFGSQRFLRCAPIPPR